MNTLKKCPRCHRHRPPEEFMVDGQSRTVCTDCRRQAALYRFCKNRPPYAGHRSYTPQPPAPEILRPRYWTRYWKKETS